MFKNLLVASLTLDLMMFKIELKLELVFGLDNYYLLYSGII